MADFVPCDLLLQKAYCTHSSEQNNTEPVQIFFKIMKYKFQSTFQHLISEQVKIASPFPSNIYIVEGEPATVACIAVGNPDEVQFVRRNELGKFGKLLNTSRVYTTSRIEKGKASVTIVVWTPGRVTILNWLYGYARPASLWFQPWYFV